MIHFSNTEGRWRAYVYVKGKRVHIKSSKKRDVVESALKDFLETKEKRLTKEEYLKKVYG